MRRALDRKDEEEARRRRQEEEVEAGRLRREEEERGRSRKDPGRIRDVSPGIVAVEKSG